MKDFIKIFLALSVVVTAFLVGRNYGEKAYLEGPQHRDVIHASEELNFAKAEFENAKIKLQNITDQAETLKTEELLAQILHVFLTDLGLRIQNKDIIIKRAANLENTKQSSEVHLKETSATELNKEPAAYPKPAPAAPKKESAWSKNNVNKFKSYEWMVQNSSGVTSAYQNLKKVQIKSLNSFLEQADYLDQDECAALEGQYKGNIKDINNKHLGALGFELKTEHGNDKAGFYGKVAWHNNGSAVSEKFNDCGKKIERLSGRIFSLAADKYIQIYKLASFDEIAGNFYQVSPNGTTTLVGSFVLRRVDKF